MSLPAAGAVTAADGTEHTSHSSRLALAVLLLWVGLFCLYLAFAGNKIGLLDGAFSAFTSGPAAVQQSLASSLINVEGQQARHSQGG